MEVAAGVISTVGNAMARNAFNNSNLLEFCQPCFSFRGHRFALPPLKALPSRHEDADDELNSRLKVPKLEWSSADSHSNCSNTTANQATDYQNKYYTPPPPAYHHHFRIDNDLQGRIKAYRAKCHRQVLDEGLSEDRAFYREFAEYVKSVWLHKDLARKYYQKALTQMEMNAASCSCSSNAGGLLAEYAEFLWKALGNCEEANRVFENAVRDYPDDVQLLGSFAYFLWELSDNN